MRAVLRGLDTQLAMDGEVGMAIQRADANRKCMHVK